MNVREKLHQICVKHNFDCSNTTLEAMSDCIQRGDVCDISKHLPDNAYDEVCNVFGLCKYDDKNKTETTTQHVFERDLVVTKQIPDELFMQDVGSVENEVDRENDFANFLNNNDVLQMDNEDTVEDKMELISSLLDKNRVVIIQGYTGCGKTTKIPRYLLSRFSSIVCTQPRRIAAISVAKKVARDMSCGIGALVGYAVRFDDCTSVQTKLRYVTDGILLRELVQGDIEATYDCIIIDEAHERTVNIDILLGYCKMLTKRNKSAKIIIMSATLSITRFVDFFCCPYVEIKHKMFPLQNYFLKNYKPEYWLAETVQTVIQLHKEETEGDILVFLTGQEEIREAYNMLGKHISNDCKLLCMYSTMPLEDQELVFKKYPIRKIILSTNICETSVTIENIVYVVDCGRVKQMRHSNNLGMDILETVMISQAQAKQRSGRAGRTRPGKVFRIYTKEEYNNMQDVTPPEMLTTNVCNGILTIKSLNVGNIKDFELIDKPKLDAMNDALEFLFLAKAVDGRGNLTKLGYEIGKIPLNPSLSVALLTSKRIGCFDDVAAISAMLTIDQIYVDVHKDNRRHKAFVSCKQQWHDNRGDFFVLLNIFRAWEKTNFSFRFLTQNFLNAKNMQLARKIKDQLTKMFNMKRCSNASKVMEAFCTGFFMNVAKISKDAYTTLFKETECYIHNTSCLYKQNAKYVLYFSIVRTRREYLKYCNVVTPEILCKSVNHIYNKRSS